MGSQRGLSVGVCKVVAGAAGVLLYPSMINLGDRVKDRVTKFTGIVVSITQHLNGCVRLGIQGAELKDGRPQECEWIDESQVTLLKPRAVAPIMAATGGPRPAPKPMKDEPSRRRKS